MGLLCSITAIGQPYDLILNTAESGIQLHQANNSITMAAGYSYTPNGGSMTAEIVWQAVSGTTAYSPIINPASYAINTGLAVGKTPGNLAVGGTASYTVPIEVPKGTNGLQPAISLNYTGSLGNGTLGIGWSLSGMSSIRRMNKTIYLDGQSDPIRCNLTDKYALDGNRLISITGTYGTDGSEYRTELEEFSKIIANGSTTTGPQWFKVYAKSGLIYEFGNTEDSRITNSSGVILSWKVNKITDRYNNYITYKYITSDDEHPIGIIEYTGNSSTSQEPFAQVLFNYKTRSDVSSYSYGSTNFTQDILLNNIEIRINGYSFKKYELDYMKDTYAQIQKITEYNSQNVALNPTVFTWSAQTAQFTQTPNYSSASDELLYVGDFNGDGRDDMVTAPNKTSYSSGDKWMLYLADTSGTLVYSTQGDLNADFESFMVNDFNGDGLSDLMMQEKHPDSTYPNKKYYYFYQSTGSTFTRSTSYYSCNDNSTLNVVDYNGDGKLEFMYNIDLGAWYLYTYSGTLITSGTLTSTSGYAQYYLMDDGMPGRILDFNGDGCSDLLVLYDNKYEIYEFKGSANALILSYTGTILDSTSSIRFGDFNGDGSLDIVMLHLLDVKFYLLSLSSDGFHAQGLSNLDSFGFTLGYNQLFARDMNADGRTDLVFVGKGTNSSNSYNRINIAYSSGNDFNITEYISSTTMQPNNSRYFNFGDFKGDGRTQLFYKYNSTSNLFSFATGTPNHLVNTIIDGLGVKTSLSYLPMSNSSVYTRGTGSTYPISDFSSAKQLVSQVTFDNGIGGINSITYQYAGAKVHQQGKGFLGFSKTTVTDVSAGISTETQMDFNTTYFCPQTKTVTKKMSSSGATVATNTDSWTQMVLDATTKRIYPYVQTSTRTNSLTGYSTSLTTSAIDNYGNPTQVVKSYSNGLTETTVDNYSGTINTSDWLISRVASSTTTCARSGETPVSQTVRYTYYVDGITKPDFIYYNEGTPLEYFKNHDYNNQGNLTQIHIYGASIGSSQTNYTYDSNGVNVLTVTDPLGHITTNTYDGYGRIYTTKDYLNNTNTYGYDAWNRPASVSSTIGSQTSTAYVWTGSNKPLLASYGVTQTGNDGSVSTVWYDKLGRAIRSEKKGFGGQMILTDTEYNSKGQVYRVSDPYFAGGSPIWAETYSYDDYGRNTGVSRNTGRNTSNSYSGATVSETTAGKTFSKTYAADGTLTSATDNGGTISYTYFPDRKVKTITNPGGVVTSMLYDNAARNQTQLTDPSAGTTVYTYDAFGRIKTQTNARNQVNTYTYLDDGRIDNVVNPEGTTSFSYNTNKQLTGVSSPNNVGRTYGYDTKGRVTSVAENIAGSNFSTSFTYDSYGRLGTRTHPSGIIETMNYNSIGYLMSISADGLTRYTVTAMNAREQLTGSTYGSSLTATYGFDAYGYPTSTSTSGVQDYRYSMDPITGNTNSRQNYLRSKSESFTYDSTHDRLLTVTGPQNLAITYNSNGNISTKSDVGTTAFSYGANTGPYTLTGVTSSTGLVPTDPQTATYTSFEKVNTLSEGVYSAAFVYNAENQRAKMILNQSGNTILTRWYAGNSYMKETAGSTTKEYTYLGGDAYSAPVAAITQGGTTTYYYLLRDYLGNITHTYNVANGTTQEYSFDAWGRRRNPTDWSYDLTNQPELFAGRGFTSHEHLPWFNLVNMNGRLYDPAVGRFLNADPYIQNPAYTQSYNRYSYCLNNPLKYADPSGYKEQFRVDTEGSVPDNVSGWEGTESLLGRGGSGGSSMYPGVGKPGQGGNGGNSLYSNYADALLKGYTGGFSNFLEEYDKQCYSQEYNGTIILHYFTHENYWADDCVNVVSKRHEITINISGQGVHSLSDAGLAFIASWEQGPNGGAALSAYDAGDGKRTIGWGHVIKKGENFSGGITLTQANNFLANDVRGTVSTINRLVTVPLSQNQFDALTSYVFNTGSLSGTRLLLNLNRGNYPGAMSEMDIVTSRGVFMQGLANRRAAEWNIWENGVYVNH